MRPCPLCGAPVDLDGGRHLQIRHASHADVAALDTLYRQLSTTDLLRRFFTAGHPPEQFIERWTDIEQRGGLLLVAEETDADSTLVVAEAGYSVLDDGDGELGITVDPAHRGWLGPWLLDALLRHAHDRGIVNMQAVVRSDNQLMLALAKRRGYAVLDHPDWGTVHLTMPTEGHTPSWPPIRDRPRVLVEGIRTRWTGEDRLRAAGFDVVICPSSWARDRGTDTPGGHRCPVSDGEPCPLISGADAVIIDTPSEEPSTQTFLTAVRSLYPDVPLIDGYHSTEELPRRRQVIDILDELERLGVKTTGIRTTDAPR